LREQQGYVEGDGQRRFECERCSGDTVRIGSHQDRISHASGVEDCPIDNASEGRMSDKAGCSFRVAAGFGYVLTHEAEAESQFGKVLRSWVGHREPSTRPQHARRLSEVPRCHDADDKIGCGIPDRPVAPQVSGGECQAGPAARGEACRCRRNIEAEGNDGRLHSASDASEVMSGATASVEHVPTFVHWSRYVPQVPRNHRANAVEMAGVKK
jgi:hypothetical protein